MRSGVNWMRLNSRSSARETVEMSRVLARPGTPSRRHVPAGEEGDEQFVDDALLPHDGLADLAEERAPELAELRKLLDVVAHAIFFLPGAAWGICRSYRSRARRTSDRVVGT